VTTRGFRRERSFLTVNRSVAHGGALSKRLRPFFSVSERDGAVSRPPLPITKGEDTAVTTTGTVRFTPRPPEDVDEPALAGHAGHDAERPRTGFVLLPRAVLHQADLSRDARLLYAVLLSYAWQEGSCFPSYQRLKADLGCGLNQVTKYLRELESAGLVTRRRRGLGHSTVYTIHDPADGGCSQDDQPTQTHRISESRVTETVKAESPVRRHEQDSGDYQAGEHHHPLAPPSTDSDERAGAVDDALLASLTEQGVTERIAVRLVNTYDAQAIREQLAWHPHRPAAKNPAGSLVEAIREQWPAPVAWLEAQEHAAAVARQAEADAAHQALDEARRREWEARPPTERIAGRLTFWVEGRRRKRQEPTPAEVEAKRVELLTELAGRAQPRVTWVDAQVASIVGTGGFAPGQCPGL
jgi:hypothetical protein